MHKISRIETALENAKYDQDQDMIEICQDELEEANEGNERAALEVFRAEILPEMPADDSIMHREAYNNYIDALQKDDYFSEDFVNQMDNPF